MLRAMTILVVVAVLACGCGAAPAATPTSQPTATTASPTRASTVAVRSTPTSEVEAAVTLAVRDLAGRLAIDAAAVQVLSDLLTEMPLQGLGCMQVGIGTPQASMPAQVLGHEVTLQAGDQEYVYRVHLKQVVLCSGMGGAAMTPIVRPGNSDAAIAAALTHLAGRLSLPSQDIQVSRVGPRDWPDASLGCPEPGKAYAQVITRGFLIVLEANGKSYEYHASLTEAKACPK